MTQKILLSKSNKPDKKYMVKVENKTIHFGQKGASDYTKHGDKDRKDRYIDRHKKNENWNKSGLQTAGFWSKHLLWNKPTISNSIKNIESNFNVDIVRKRS